MNTKNSFGLFDAPIPRSEPEHLVFRPDEMDFQLASGAFVLDRGEAVKFGFINPYDDDTVRLTVYGGME
jgi:hypothetical protein